MKGIFATVILFMVITTGAFAQTSNDLFKMRNAEDADLVLKVLTNDLSLPADVHGTLRDILQKSAKSQQDQMARMQTKDANMESAIIARQTAHIETNMKNLIGEEKYKLYEQLKEKIVADVNKLKH